MIELVYMSHAVDTFSEEKLKNLLEQSRKNNQKNGISGLLIYDGVSTFVQALEGEKEAVEALYEKIKNDKRHSDLLLLATNQISQRSFEDWKMSFKLLKLSDAIGLKGYSNFMESDYEAKKQTGGFALEMLKHFKQTVNVYSS